MDQLKDILKQAIKYRFWIAVGLAAVFAMTAYFIGSGPIKAKADTETANIKKGDDGVKPYASGVQINAQYKPIVAEKTEVLTKDVNGSWKKLYARQAPLLTWPDRVTERFSKWGRKWPENVDPSAVQFAVIDYVNAYPEYAANVYKTLNALDPEGEKGVVFAAPEPVLLQTATFDLDKGVPSLGKVWASQEKLWIQRTLLEVVAHVNKDAKDWDGATIKSVRTLSVGSKLDQDQRSIAKGDELEEAPAIDDPAKPAESTETAAAGGAAGGAAMYEGGTAAPTGMMPGMAGGMAGAAGAAGASDKVYYIKTPSDQFKVMPVHMVVWIDQNHIQDFLVALENSPMNVQVMDFEMAKPGERVVKPEKGAVLNAGMGGMPGMGAEGMMRGMMGTTGMTGMGGNYGKSMRGMMDMMPGAGGMYGGMMGGGGPAAKGGVDKRAENLAKKREDQIKAAKAAGGGSLHDPYYNIVEVKIWGQARFFNPPPEEAPAEPSQAETAPPAEGEKKAEDAAKPDAEKKAEDAPKAEAEKGAEAAPKAEAEKRDAPAPKAEAEKKAEDAPKTDAAKKDTPGPKAEPEKKAEEAPKPDAEKKDAPPAPKF